MSRPTDGKGVMMFEVAVPRDRDRDLTVPWLRDGEDAKMFQVTGSIDGTEVALIGAGIDMVLAQLPNLRGT